MNKTRPWFAKGGFYIKDRKPQWIFTFFFYQESEKFFAGFDPSLTAHKGAANGEERKPQGIFTFFSYQESEKFFAGFDPSLTAHKGAPNGEDRKPQGIFTFLIIRGARCRHNKIGCFLWFQARSAAF